jgi:hypothetical protein
MEGHGGGEAQGVAEQKSNWVYTPKQHNYQQLITCPGGVVHSGIVSACHTEEIGAMDREIESSKGFCLVGVAFEK